MKLLPLWCTRGLRAVSVLALLSLATLASLNNQAQAAQPTPGYPDRPIRMIIPFPAGGTTDFVARLVTTRITTMWAQPVVIDNRGGAAGMIGATEGARAKPDGYTVTLGNNQTHATNATLFAHPQFDIVHGVQPIAMLTRTRHVIVVRTDAPYKNFQQLVDAGKSHMLTYASPSTGSSAHIISSSISTKLGMQTTHIPYRGAAPAVMDMLAGHVDFMTATYGSVATYLKPGGKLRALAITGEQRDPQMPDVPTFNELGLQSLSLDSWIALYAPLNTPAPIVQAWSDALGTIMKDPAVVKALQTQGFEVWYKPVSEMKTFHAEEIERWGDLVRKANIHLD